jgi:hypothetical protein
LNAAQAAWLPEIRGQTSEAGGQKSEVGGRKSDAARILAARADNNVGGQKPEAGDESAEDAGEDAEVATTETNSAAETNAAPPPPDDEGYVWPEGSEAAPEGEKQNAAAPEVANAPLPSLDELVKRIPADVRETLDDLFRVKFTSVKRVPPTSLKS